MPDQNRNQQGNRNRNKQSSQQGSERRDNRDNTQQTQGNRTNPDETVRDDEVEEIGSTDPNRSNREPASIANDRSRGNERLRRDGEDGELVDELGTDIENETDMEDVDEDDLGSGGSNR